MLGGHPLGAALKVAVQVQCRPWLVSALLLRRRVQRAVEGCVTGHARRQLHGHPSRLRRRKYVPSPEALAIAGRHPHLASMREASLCRDSVVTDAHSRRSSIKRSCIVCCTKALGRVPKCNPTLQRSASR